MTFRISKILSWFLSDDMQVKENLFLSLCVQAFFPMILHCAEFLVFCYRLSHFFNHFLFLSLLVRLYVRNSTYYDRFSVF